MKKNRFVKVLFVIFLVLGLVLMVVGGMMMVHQSHFEKNAKEVMATITDIQTYRSKGADSDLEHDVYVEYEYKGQLYETELNFYSSDMYVGKTITLLVDPLSPGQVNVKGMLYLFAMIPLLIGVIFALIGGITLLVMEGSKRKNKNLKETGKRIQATINEITINYNVSVNNSHPYRIICSYKDEYTGLIYRFKSGNVWTDPSYVCEIGGYIDVFVKPDDYSKNYVDAEALFENKIVDYT